MKTAPTAVRSIKQKHPTFDSTKEAIQRLKRFGAVEEHGVVYIQKPIGLKVLGAVDYLRKHEVFVVFGKPPKQHRLGLKDVLI